MSYTFIRSPKWRSNIIYIQQQTSAKTIFSIFLKPYYTEKIFITI